LRLSNRLSESDAALEKISSELEQLKTSEAERSKLSSVVDKKIELLQNLLQVKERRVQKLEQARSKLTDDTKRLLRTCATRDQALARAEEKISSLTELFSQLETKAELAANTNAPASKPTVTPFATIAFTFVIFITASFVHQMEPPFAIPVARNFSARPGCFERSERTTTDVGEPYA
jgi:hypothetical protein